jgi:hypothetical protein
MQSGGNGNEGQQHDSSPAGKNRPDEMGGHADQDPSHQLSHPEHPAAGPWQLGQLARKKSQDEERQAESQGRASFSGPTPPL